MPTLTTNILIQPLAKTRQAGWANVPALTADIHAAATSQNKAGGVNVAALTAKFLLRPLTELAFTTGSMCL